MRNDEEMMETLRNSWEMARKLLKCMENGMKCTQNGQKLHGNAPEIKLSARKHCRTAEKWCRMAKKQAQKDKWFLDIYDTTYGGEKWSQKLTGIIENTPRDIQT